MIYEEANHYIIINWFPCLLNYNMILLTSGLFIYIQYIHLFDRKSITCQTVIIYLVRPTGRSLHSTHFRNAWCVYKLNILPCSYNPIFHTNWLKDNHYSHFFHLSFLLSFDCHVVKQFVHATCCHFLKYYVFIDHMRKKMSRKQCE